MNQRGDGITIAIGYESYQGGTNNLIVATDLKTGEFSTSLISKEHAIRALRRKNKGGKQND